MTGEVAGKLLQLYLHSLPGKMFVKWAIENAEQDIYGIKEEQASLMMAIKVAYKKKGHIVNV
jgi:hypothetical protein